MPRFDCSPFPFDALVRAQLGRACDFVCNRLSERGNGNRSRALLWGDTGYRHECARETRVFARSGSMGLVILPSIFSAVPTMTPSARCRAAAMVSGVMPLPMRMV